MRPEDIKVEVKFTEGYQKRYTEACLKVIKQREERAQREQKEQGKVIA